MLNQSLPQSYKDKDLRKKLSEKVEFLQLPHPFSGCYKPFEKCLIESLQHLLHQGITFFSPIEVKLSGDGAPFYRSTSFILLSFSFPSTTLQQSQLQVITRYHTSIAPVVHQTEQARTLASIENCLQSKNKLGVKNKPLFNIETDRVIVDELHLLLRMSYVLINNLVLATIAQDNNLLTRSTIHLDTLLDKVHECCTFRVKDWHYGLVLVLQQVWESKTKKGEYEFTSLRGADRKKLWKLPPYIVDVIPRKIGLKIMKLWSVTLIRKDNTSHIDITT
uniref:Uncharacterized protein n=1 Tax=Amphimedon queenslandica TaxID=400682 RepID=A0A1X7UI92_AMPQE